MCILHANGAYKVPTQLLSKVPTQLLCSGHIESASLEFLSPGFIQLWVLGGRHCLLAVKCKELNLKYFGSKKELIGRKTACNERALSDLCSVAIYQGMQGTWASRTGMSVLSRAHLLSVLMSALPLGRVGRPPTNCCGVGEKLVMVPSWGPSAAPDELYKHAAPIPAVSKVEGSHFSERGAAAPRKMEGPWRVSH